MGKVKLEDYNVVNFVDAEFKNVNSFLIVDKERRAILFDCWIGSVEEINRYIKQNDLKLEHIFLSHGHYEHINGLEQVYIENNDPTVYIGADDLPNLYDAELNQSAMFYVEKFIASDKVKNIKSIMGDTEYEINGLKINAYIKTSHTTGSAIYAIDDLKMVFTGDAAFCSANTTIFDESLVPDWDETIRWMFKKFPKNYFLMAGHHEYGTTLGKVAKNNTFIKQILKRKK